MLASWCLLSTNSVQQSPFDIWSLRKWCLISICLVLECMTGFLDRLIALVLSHFKRMWSRITPKFSRCCFIQRLWAQQLSTAIYSTFAVDSATQASFLQFQDTREPPKRWHVPLVLSYLAYTLQSQNLKSQLDLRRYLWDTTNQHWLYMYLIILLTTIKWDSLGLAWYLEHKKTLSIISG